MYVYMCVCVCVRVDGLYVLVDDDGELRSDDSICIFSAFNSVASGCGGIALDECLGSTTATQSQSDSG